MVSLHLASGMSKPIEARLRRPGDRRNMLNAKEVGFTATSKIGFIRSILKYPVLSSFPEIQPLTPLGLTNCDGRVIGIDLQAILQEKRSELGIQVLKLLKNRLAAYKVSSAEGGTQ